MTAVDVLAVLDEARAECRARGHLLNPYRLGLFVGFAGYDRQEVPAPYTHPKSVRVYANGISWGLNSGGKDVRRKRIDEAAALARCKGEGYSETLPNITPPTPLSAPEDCTDGRTPHE